MLTEILQEVEYIHVPFANWYFIYNTVHNNGLIGVPIIILFHYKKSVHSEVVVGISPVTQNTKLTLAFEGYTQKNTTLNDDNNDFFEDNNTFDILPEEHQKQLMQEIHKVGLLGQQVNVFYKVNNNLNDVVKISYTEDNNQHHSLYTYKKNIREVAYVITNNTVVTEIQELLDMEPINVFIKRLA